MPNDFTPGALVRHPKQPDWGIGQVQSVVGNRITANFENAGKRVINGDVVRLEAAKSPVTESARAGRRG